MATILRDKSNGYDAIAEHFIRARNSRIGPATVAKWSERLPHGASILDLGCGHGVPISQALINRGFALYGVDASAKLIAEFRERFPGVEAECAAAEDSAFFHRTFDAAIAWGLMFLLPADVQTVVIGKVSKALNPGGKFLFTSPEKAHNWPDSLTGRESISLGAEAYRQALVAEGLILEGESLDEGDNHYYLEWLKNFQNRGEDVRPGDALRALVRTEIRYGYEGDVIGTSYTILKVIGVIRFNPPFQERLST